MNVRGRVGRLERSLGAAGACPLCRGLGEPALSVVWGEGGPAPPEPGPGEAPGPPPPADPRGCPRCGRVRLTVIRVEWEDRTPAAAAHDRRR